MKGEATIKKALAIFAIASALVIGLTPMASAARPRVERNGPLVWMYRARPATGSRVFLIGNLHARRGHWYECILSEGTVNERYVWGRLERGNAPGDRDIRIHNARVTDNLRNTHCWLDG